MPVPKVSFVRRLDCIQKQLQQIEKKVGMEYQKAYKQVTRVVRIVTKVKGRPYFFVIIKRLLKSNFKCMPGGK